METIRVAHVAGGVVTNVSIRKAGDPIPDGMIALEPGQRVGPGWGYTGDAFTEPEPTPEPVDPQSALLEALADEWNAAAANLRAGKAEEAAEALDRAAETARSAARGQ